MTTETRVSESTLRRRFATRGYRLWKVAPSSSRFAEYGPWAVVDTAGNYIVDSGLRREDLPGWISEYSHDDG